MVQFYTKRHRRKEYDKSKKYGYYFSEKEFHSKFLTKLKNNDESENDNYHFRNNKVNLSSF